MRWWWRWILTLGLGPLVWWALSGYVATQQGTSVTQWVADVPKPSAYGALTAPAALLCLVLTGMERLLKVASLDLFTVLLSPLCGFGLAWCAVNGVPPLQDYATLISVFAVYGLVWGLTIREPRKRPTALDRSDGAFVEALLPRDET